MNTDLEDKDKQVKKIIEEAIDLPESQAHEYIKKACAGDMDLFHQVVAAYRTVKQGQKNDKTHLVAGQSVNKVETSSISLTQKLFGNKRNRLILLVAFFMLLLLLGLLTRHLVVRNILDAESERKLMLISNNKELVLNWIKKDMQNTQSIANVPLLRNYAIALDSLSRIDAEYKALKKHELTQEATGLLLRLKDFYEVAGISLINVNEPKLLLHTAQLNSVGVSNVLGYELGRKAYKDFLVVRTGKLHFSPPMRVEEYLYNAPGNMIGDMWSHSYSPVYNFDGEIVAILSTLKSGSTHFSEVFETARYSESSETFAVSSEGKMLSTSRFKDVLYGTGLSSVDSTMSAIYNLNLYDPGVNLMRKKDINPAELGTGFIRIIQEMFIHVNRNDSILSGVITEPFNDYRGVKVIGAWTWIGEYNFGIITQQDLSEVLSATKYVNRILFASLLIILVLGYLLYHSNIRIVRFGKKLEDIQALGQYKLKNKIGEGGFGEVYRAEHSLLKNDVAIKILKKEYVGTDMLQKFQKEVEVTSSLNHPNTVRVYDYGKTEHQQFYYVMEFLNGIELSKLAGMYEEFPINRMVYILLQTCYSLKEAHAKGLVHRDINPKNILVCNQGGAFDLVKVLDFGLVKRMDSSFTEHTQAGDVSGTLMFMAPERIRDPYNVDYSVDIFSIGAVGLYLLSGQYIMELLMAKLMSKDAKADDVYKQGLINREDIPEDLQQILLACVQFNPDNRPKTVEELIKYFNKFLLKDNWSLADAEKWWKQYDAYS